MTEILFQLNVVMTALFLIEGFWKRAGYLQLPFLSAMIYAVWYLPQAAVLVNEPPVPDGGLADVLGMSLLCLIAIKTGWHRGLGSALFKRFELEEAIKRLVCPTLILTLFAITMKAAIMAQPDDVRAMSQWTGPITILAFFSRVATVSLVLSLAIVIRHRTLITIALAGANILMYAAPLLIYFRRSDTAEFIFTVLLCVFFLMGKAIPRLAVIGGLVVAFAFINGVAHLRSLSGGYVASETGKIETRIPTLGEIRNIDWFDFRMFEEGKYQSETYNAAVYMSVIDRQCTPIPRRRILERARLLVCSWSDRRL